jgi:hypothetical protein
MDFAPKNIYHAHTLLYRKKKDLNKFWAFYMQISLNLEILLVPEYLNCVFVWYSNTNIKIIIIIEKNYLSCFVIGLTSGNSHETFLVDRHLKFNDFHYLFGVL